MSASDPSLHALLERHLPGLRAFVRLKSGPMIRDLEASTDLVQSVCREVLEQRDRFRHGGESGFRRWMYRTALRKIADRYAYYRAQKRDVRRDVPLEQDSSRRDVASAYASVATPSRGAAAREEIERVEHAFDQLSEIQREVILGARLLQLSHRELADHVGRTESATRTLLCRATARLVELLDAPGHTAPNPEPDS